MNELEKRYVELTIAAQHVPLSDDEQKETEEIQTKLNLVPCDVCKGEGWFSFPSMLGYGRDEGACKKCEGTGELGMSESLHNELKKIFNPEPEDLMGEHHGRNY